MVPQSQYPVLLLAGNEELVQLLRHALQPEGMSVTVVTSFALAKEALQVTAYAVVVTERAISGKDGLSLLSFMRGDGRYERVPIVVVVSAAIPAESPGAFADVAVLRTPIEPPVVARLLRLLAVASTEPRS